MTIKPSIRPWLTLVLGLAAGAGLGYFLAPDLPADLPGDAEIRQGGYAFIRPLLDCEIDEPVSRHTELRYFKKELLRVVRSLEDGRAVRSVAVYFRDLDNGPWMGAKEEKAFTPASLYKVPLIIASMKQAEVAPGFLDDRAAFSGFPDPDLGAYHFPPARTLAAGESYTIMELIDRTARYSDNAAALTLGKAVDPAVLDRVYRDLGIDPEASLYGSTSSISAEALGRFFRVLYNASYLNRDFSELALQTFSLSTFREGLAAGVPDGVTISHKFGEKMKEEGGERIVQLHDAGIVYHPDKPYLLCVLTLGTDYRAQAEAISSVSRFVWDEVTRQMRVGADGGPE